MVSLETGVCYKAHKFCPLFDYFHFWISANWVSIGCIKTPKEYNKLLLWLFDKSNWQNQCCRLILDYCINLVASFTPELLFTDKIHKITFIIFYRNNEIKVIVLWRWQLTPTNLCCKFSYIWKACKNTHLITCFYSQVLS